MELLLQAQRDSTLIWQGYDTLVKATSRHRLGLNHRSGKSAGS